MTTYYRALLEDLVEEVIDANQYMPPGVQSAIERARAALAEPEIPSESPTDEELWEVYDQMDGVAEDWEWSCDYARAVLARWGNQP